MILAELCRTLIALERRLHAPTHRKDPTALDNLLAEEFLEFGASGTVWTRAETIEALQNEPSEEIRGSDFSCRELAQNVVLLTYFSQTSSRRALRSSVWRLEDGKWRVVFHQGPLFHQIDRRLGVTRLAMAAGTCQDKAVEKERILALLREHEAELKASGLLHLRLFGSVARGDNTAESDVDLLADWDASKPISLLTVARCQYELEDLLGCSVDLSQAGAMYPQIRARALAEAVLAF